MDLRCLRLSIGLYRSAHLLFNLLFKPHDYFQPIRVHLNNAMLKFVLHKKLIRLEPCDSSLILRWASFLWSEQNLKPIKASAAVAAAANEASKSWCLFPERSVRVRSIFFFLCSCHRSTESFPQRSDYSIWEVGEIKHRQLSNFWKEEISVGALL